MGSIESTVSEMDDTQEQSELVSSVNVVPERNRRRRRRHTTGNTDLRTTNESLTNTDDPWWWEVENENLILDQVLVVPTSIENNANSNINVSNFSNESEEPSIIDENTIHSTKSTCVKSIQKNDDKTDGFELNTNRSKTEVSEYEFRSSKREQSLDDFKKELRMKRLERQNAVQDLRNEIASLKQQLSAEKALTRRLKHNRDCEPTDNIVELPNGEDEACALSTPSVFDTDDEDPKSRGRHANIELANAQLSLQLANSENISLRTELGVVQKQVCTLKEVIACCKQMLAVKEEQCSQLKSKLQDIEKSFADREMSMMSDNLRQEYERQLSNIRQLRQLYEERQRVAAAEYENLQRLISIKKDELQAEQEKTKNFEERNYSLVKEVELVNNELSALRDECNEHKFEKRALKDEMGAVNTLFSQMVTGFSGKNTLDIDRLTMMLEENRSLLSEIAAKEMNISDGATLPKLLFELVEEAAVSCHDNHSLENLGDGCERIDLQNERMLVDGEPKINANTKINDSSADNANGNELEMNFVKNGAAAACSVNDQMNISVQKQEDANIESKTSKAEFKIDVEQNKSVTMMNLYEPEILGQVASTQEIIINLPKVWKVLIELLSHHKTEQKKFFKSGDWDDCDKSIEAQSDSKTELSVSKTYIKLKDLIFEKKSLVKETNRLKTLNSHLEYRLNEQEKRLSVVSLELTKTWHLVGKMQRQHRQLHTQEQILRYQLQQKRRLLTELKDELEYCRRKWATARAKNEETQQQWDDLRREFAKRKLDDASNSAESGFSDSGAVSDEEERGDQGSSPEPSGVVLGSSTSACSRRKYFKEMFEHTRKIKRMQSTSPGRAINSQTGVELVLRWNSAPPTCGWRRNNEKIGEKEQSEDGRVEGGKDEEESTDSPPSLLVASPKGGAISKRHKIVGKNKSKTNDTSESDANGGPENQSHHTDKIHKLEEQCKSLIKRVLETSDNRERLEIQLCRFEDEIAPVQYSVPLNEFINKKRLERMTRASSVPATGTLTPREEEYTRKRSERLERLEEESRQLLSRIKRTTDRGNYLRSFLDSIRRGPNEPNHEDSYESNTEEEDIKNKTNHEEFNSELSESNYGIKEVPCTSQKLVEEEAESLTNEEKAYTSRRTERLKRLERESKQLLESLTQNNQRSESLVNRLDDLHGRYSGIENNKLGATNTVEQCSEAIHPLHNQDNNMIPTLTSVDNTSEGEAIISQAVVPTPKNVASSSIVDDELRDIVTVTTVPSQIAQPHLGAIPKSKVKSQLCVERIKSGGLILNGPKRNNLQSDCVRKDADESLEEMVKRLRALPFPNEDVTNKNEKYSNTETKNRKSE